MEWNEELTSVVFTEPAVPVRDNAVQERARVFGKWLWIYFWVMMASFVPGIINFLEEQLQTGTIIGTVIGWGCSAFTIYVTFRLGTVQDRMRTSAILTAVALAGEIVMQFVNSETVSMLWAIPGIVIGLVSTYQFMYGCGDALAGVDNEQSNKWYKLWKWYVWLLVGGLLGMILLLVLAAMLQSSLLSILSAISIVVWAVFVVVWAVKQYVYIYRTAKIFRGIAENL